MVESLDALAGGLLEATPPDQVLRVCLPGWTAEVRTNSAELKERLVAYFAGFQTDDGGEPSVVVNALQAPEPDLGLTFVDWKREGGKRGRKDSFCDRPEGRALRKVRTGMQYVMTDAVRLIVGDCLTNANQVVNFVNALHMSHLLGRGGVLCHAAAVHGPRGGLAIAGFSGAGKSTTTLHLLAAGSTFVSNDRLVVSAAGGQVIGAGVPKWPRVNPGSLLTVDGLADVLPPGRREALSALPRESLWELEEKYDLFVARRYGPERVRLETPLVGLLILAWEREASDPVRFEQVDLGERPDLLAAVEKSAGVFHVAADGSRATRPSPAPRDAYVDVLGRIPVTLATGRVDFAAATARCRALLGHD